MGPPELPGGNDPPNDTRGRPRRRFNGAAGITRRKQKLSQTAAPAAPTLQWGRRNYPAETTDPNPPALPRDERFNGAAGITRRKRLTIGTIPALAASASMGPPELPGGNHRLATHPPTHLERFNGAAGITRRKPKARSVILPSTCCFNGAAGITRRKPAPGMRIRAGIASLQWGRRNYPAETVHAPPLRPNLGAASMGPPELPGGNGGVLGCVVGHFGLQWGRRNYPAETAFARSHHTRGGAVLQWGRRNYPAETYINNKM